MSKHPLDVKIMLGLDDIAHDRLLQRTKDGFEPIKGYGKRNHKERCFCAELKRLGIKRKRYTKRADMLI